MKCRQTGDTQETAAAKAGIGVRTGRRIEKNERRPARPRDWRTRDDPFLAVWESELLPLLELEPKLSGLTLWDYLDERYPGQYPERLLRTLQRRVKHWRATQGPQKPVIFRQSIPAGHQGLSDFTHPNAPITIAGKPFQHLLYQFRLAFSGWRSVLVVRGGESYSALADGLQTALHELGGVPMEHRTDSLSAAWSNDLEKKKLTQAYGALCQHYRMQPTTNNLGISHENGAIESYHGSLKHRIDQALKLRGSNDFTSVKDYQQFINTITKKLNKRGKARLAEEQRHLQPLPEYRFIDYTELSVRVTTSSTISVKRCLYTVPSRLIGERLRVHVYHDRLICFIAQTTVGTLTRVYPATPSGRTRSINYHHVIHSLAAKPQAFRFSQFRDDLLPSEQYRALWVLCEQQFTPQQACKWMVAVLRMACDYNCESTLGTELLVRAQHNPLPDLTTLQRKYLRSDTAPVIPLKQHSVADYDELLAGRWTQQEVVCG